MEQPPPQQQLGRMLTGYWISQAIYVIAKLGLTDLLKDGPKTADEFGRPPRKPIPDRSIACSAASPALASLSRMTVAVFP